MKHSWCSKYHPLVGSVTLYVHDVIVSGYCKHESRLCSAICWDSSFDIKSYLPLLYRTPAGPACGGQFLPSSNSPSSSQQSTVQEFSHSSSSSMSSQYNLITTLWKKSVIFVVDHILLKTPDPIRTLKINGSELGSTIIGDKMGSPMCRQLLLIFQIFY